MINKKRRDLIGRIPAFMVLFPMCPKTILGQGVQEEYMDKINSWVADIGPDFPIDPPKPPFNPFATPHHNLDFNNLRVYDVDTLKKKLEDGDEEFVVLSRTNDDLPKGIPPSWGVVSTHTEILPLVASKRADLDSIYYRDLKKGLAGQDNKINMYINGEQDKYIPVTKYLNQYFEIKSAPSEIEKVEDYKEVKKAIHKDIGSIGIGYRSQSFDNMKLLKLISDDGSITKGIPITHTVIMKNESGIEPLEEWVELIKEGFKTDMDEGGINLLDED